MSKLPTRYEQPAFRTLEEMLVRSSEVVEPPERLTISEAAVRYVKIREKNYTGPWSADRTPYLVEPQNLLASLDYTSMIFAGPARCGKSQMLLNWIAYTAKCDPMDMMVLHMTTGTGRDWSLSALAKLFRNSPELAATLKPGRQNDNVFDKEFLSGMRLTIIHPSISELSGKTVGRNWAVDYDRLDPDVDNEGDPFTLLAKRATTLKRYGMTVAESSPGFEILDPTWRPSTPHEAPPTEGILSLYNGGDRRRWHWRCPQCNDPFEGTFKLLSYPDSDDPMECAEQVRMICPSCGFPMLPDMQYEMNLTGKWLREGEVWLPDGTVAGKARRSHRASYWLQGVAAGFTNWGELVQKYVEAHQEFTRSQSEEKLKVVTNTDLGLPYLPKAMTSVRTTEGLRDRAEAYNERAQVPIGTAFLMSMIDVQGGARSCFVVHTFGITPVLMENGVWSYDIYHVDMWKIRKSNRRDADGESLRIDPASYPEDWDCLIDDVLKRKYPLADGSGRMMKVKLVGCDSGGAASSLNKSSGNAPVVSVTSNAYDFYRRLFKMDMQFALQFCLLKGSPSLSGSRPDIYRTFPDSGQKSQFAVARGDVPVWLVNSNAVKDTASNMLARLTPGGRVHFPIWYDDNGNLVDTGWLYSQLTTEVRTAKGWVNPSRRKNEAFDLLSYCIAFLKSPDIRINDIDFNKPPSWANPDWDKNTLVVTIKDGKEESVSKPVSVKSRLSQLGKLLS